MIAQIVYLEVQPQLLEPFILEVKANVLASRQEWGVAQFELLQQLDNPLKFMLYEVYNSAEDIESHRQTSHFKRWLEVGVPMLTGERVRIMYEKL
jgi:(4S)-4-hydroxy-5-phosphonooxypentane-2,3-dione isomerase